MNCETCATPLQDEARFCGRCGAPAPTQEELAAEPADGDPVLYCTFLGCTRRGIPTSAERCPECNRWTSPTPPPISHQPDPTQAPLRLGGTTPGRAARTPEQRLAEDAVRVGDVLTALSYLVVAFGGIAALVLLIAALANGDGLAAVITALAFGVYTLAAWAVLMLGSVVARYVALRSR